MSDSETTGRCRSEMEKACGTSSSIARVDLVLADALDRLAADVAAVKAKIDAVSPEDVRHFVDSEKAWVKLVEDQRDAAIRERNEARALLELAQVQRTAAYADRDEARAEVYRLKCSMTETIKERDAAIRERDEARAEVGRLRAGLAALPAADVQPIGWIARHEHAPPVGKYVMCRWDVEERQGYARQVSYGAAKRGPDGMWRSPTGVEKIAPMHWMPLPPGVEGGDEWEQQTPAAPQPAAPAAGWLTEREQHALRHILAADVEPAIRSILSRAGSPPVVEVPPISERDVPKRNEALAYRAALDAAGVKWKEVGRE